MAYDINNNKTKCYAIFWDKSLDESIDSIKSSIDKVIEREKKNTQQEIDVLIEEMNSKEEYKN
jgi:hypothetical protein